MVSWHRYLKLNNVEFWLFILVHFESGIWSLSVNQWTIKYLNMRLNYSDFSPIAVIQKFKFGASTFQSALLSLVFPYLGHNDLSDLIPVTLNFYEHSEAWKILVCTLVFLNSWILCSSQMHIRRFQDFWITTVKLGFGLLKS